ncbi:MAG: HAD-IA family hydrolase [Rikenellaceae bacterium]
MKKLVIFDLDGTLLDTIEDLAAACDAMLTKHDLPTYTIDEYRGFVGNGILRLVERAIPESKRTPEYVELLRKDFLKFYFENIDKKTKIYPGVELLLKHLVESGVEIAVASNKFQEGTRKLVANLFPRFRFSAVLGQRPNIPLKPNPQIVREILQITSYAPDTVLYVGDSGVDIQTAKASDVESVGVTWGFRSREELEECGADHIVDRAEDILKLVMR